MLELPVETFLAELVRTKTPVPDPTKKQSKVFHGCALKSVRHEKDIYAKLAGVVNSILKVAKSQYASKLEYLDTAPCTSRADARPTETHKDAGVYALFTEEARKTTDFTAEESNKCKTKKSDSRNRLWDYAAVAVEIRHDTDPAAIYFKEQKETSANDNTSKSETRVQDDDEDDDMKQVDDYGEPEVADTRSAANVKPHLDHEPTRDLNAGRQAFGRISENISNIFKRQHRTFVYSIYILGDKCRLLYNDHSGGFISSPFKWTVRNSLLHVFIWKIAHMELSEMGYDSTAMPASEQECMNFRAAGECADTLEVRQYVLDAMAHDCPIYKIQVVTRPVSHDEMLPPDRPGFKEDEEETGGQVYEFIVGNACFAADSLTGHCTKGYIAYNLAMKKLCFLKDCWRIVEKGRTRPEHLLYRRLHKHSVPYIMKVICGGDVYHKGSSRRQETRVREYRRLQSEKKPIARVHYRLVTEEICVPLRKFTHFKELVLVFIYAIFAHKCAWENAHLLHRDISVGNIMIDPKTRRGYLIDWDLARFACELPDGPVEPDRSGTWQYRSALALNFPRKPYRLSDDIESFVHAFHHLVLQFHDSSVDDFYYVTHMYDTYKMVGNVMVGGSLKLEKFQTPIPHFKVNNAHLQDILDILANGCYESYCSVDLGRMQELYGVSKEEVSNVNMALDMHDSSDPDLDDLLDKVTDHKPVEARRSVPQDSSRDLPTLAGSPRDPSLMEGFLSQHTGLLACFKDVRNYSAAEFPKGIDYFRTLCQETPIVLSKSGTTGEATPTIDYWPILMPRPTVTVPDANVHALATSSRLHKSNGEEMDITNALATSSRLYKSDEEEEDMAAARSHAVAKQLDVLSQNSSSSARVRKHVRDDDTDDNDKSGTKRANLGEIDRLKMNSLKCRKKRL